MSDKPKGGSRNCRGGPKARKRPYSTSKKSIERADRDREAMALRAAGKGYDEIAGTLGYANRSGAYKAVVRVLEQWRADTYESAEIVLDIELQRLDVMLEALWPKASSGDTLAIDRVIKLMDRRAKFLGLDAASKSEVSGPGGAPLVDFSTMSIEELAVIARGGPGNIRRS